MSFVVALASAAPALAAHGQVELVVTLRAPSLADAAVHDRALASVTMRRNRLDLSSPSSVSYIQLLTREQTAVARRIARAIPGAWVRWRYAITLNGLAVVVPAGETAALARVPGVAKVWPTATYRAALDRTPQLIGAPALWGPTLATAGQGMKIGVIDEGVDQTHPFLSPAGFTMPAGYPKGQASYTTAKVIVARAFAPPTPKWKYADLPFDPQNSEHGTHVAGIAAGDNGTQATGFAGSPILSGVAPKAYIGNYKALTIPTPGFGLDGNAPEIAKAIDQAVADGMDVINLSLGEPEIEQSRDIVVKAINGAAAAGVVPVIAAGNDFSDFGVGSVGSPGSAPDAITVAASTSGRGSAADLIAGFSSSGPTPYSLQLKPDVTAPGFSVLSSVPAREGTWAIFSGTSMATPHVAGAAALLKQLHPTWTVAQVKSALAQTGDPVWTSDSRTAETSPLRQGGGRIDLPAANAPLLFASPSSISFGLQKPTQSATLNVQLTDAGGGAGQWTAAVSSACPYLTVPGTVTAPGALAATLAVPSGAGNGECTGFVVLMHNGQTRRIAFWAGIESPKLGAPLQTLVKTGTYSGDTSKGQANVDTYRYPEPSIGLLAGPEVVYAVKIAKPVANFGVRILSQSGGARIQPRIVRSGDENRLAGYTALPFDLNPYRDLFGRNVLVVGTILPVVGTYDVVFDSTTAALAGKFSFRLWIDDVTPPTVKLIGYRRNTVTLTATDAGSGVDPQTLDAAIDGVPRNAALILSKVVVFSGPLSKGTHELRLVVSDYQETKNMEDVGPILPNTRTFTAKLKVR